MSEITGQAPQQSQQWFEDRAAKITSSGIYSLMGVKTLKPNDKLPTLAKSYIFQKYAELTTGLVPQIKSWTLEWGKENEPLAKTKMEQMNGVDMWECEYIQHKERYYYGGSPDGVLPIENDKKCVEIKCPASTAEQYKNIWAASDAKTMRRDYPELYWQLQSNMYLLSEVYKYDITDAIFVSYDKRIRIGNASYFQSFIKRNDEDIELMLQQIDKAWLFYQQLGFQDDIDVIAYLHPDNVAKRKLQQSEITPEDIAAFNDAAGMIRK